MLARYMSDAVLDVVVVCQRRSSLRGVESKVCPLAPRHPFPAALMPADTLELSDACAALYRIRRPAGCAPIPFPPKPIQTIVVSGGTHPPRGGGDGCRLRALRRHAAALRRRAGYRRGSRDVLCTSPSRDLASTTSLRLPSAPGQSTVKLNPPPDLRINSIPAHLEKLLPHSSGTTEAAAAAAAAAAMGCGASSTAKKYDEPLEARPLPLSRRAQTHPTPCLVILQLDVESTVWSNKQVWCRTRVAEQSDSSMPCVAAMVFVPPSKAVTT